MKTFQIKSKHNFTHDSKVISCNTIILHELKGKDRFIAREIKELCLKETINTSVLHQKMSSSFSALNNSKKDVPESEADNSNPWTSLIQGGFSSANFINSIEKILVENSLIQFAVTKDYFIDLKDEIDNISLDDLNKILGVYLDTFFTI